VIAYLAFQLLYIRLSIACGFLIFFHEFMTFFSLPRSLMSAFCVLPFYVYLPIVLLRIEVESDDYYAFCN